MAWVGARAEVFTADSISLIKIYQHWTR